VKIVNN